MLTAPAVTQAAVALCGARPRVFPGRHDEARLGVPDPALARVHKPGVYQILVWLGPDRIDGHLSPLSVDAVFAQAQVGAGDRVGGPGSAHPDPGTCRRRSPGS